MARRKTFQQGTVIERKYEYGTAFILRYRIRKSDGSWQEKSETLKDCSSKKATLKILSERLTRSTRETVGQWVITRNGRLKISSVRNGRNMSTTSASSRRPAVRMHRF